MVTCRTGRTAAHPTDAPRGRGLALLTSLAAQFMFAMDLLIVVVALPRIQHDLGFNPAGLTWVPNAFGLAFGGLLLLGGRLGDMLGQLRAFRTGIFVFVLAPLQDGYLSGVLPSLLVHAAGIALVFAPGSVAIMHGVPAQDAGAASGLLQMDQQIGGALGIAVMASIYAPTAAPASYVSGLPAAFAGGAALAGVAAFIAWRCVRAPAASVAAPHVAAMLD